MQIQAIIKNVFFPKRCKICAKVQGFAPVCSCSANLHTICLPPLALQGLPCAQQVEGAFAQYAYAPPVMAVLLAMKTKAGKKRSVIFAKELASFYKQVPMLQACDCVVCVPQANTKKYCHNTQLATHFAQFANLPFCNGVIGKVFATKPQKKLQMHKRKSSLLGAFTVFNAKPVQGKTVLLVDDIITTGATINECAKMLLYAGAKEVYALSIACSFKD